MKQKLSQRLLKYSSAAGAGAFAISSADAAIVHQASIDGFSTVTLTSGNNFSIDINDDGSNDFSIENLSSDIGRVFDIGSSSTLTSSGSYYVFGFTNGQLIDSGASSAGSAFFAHDGNGLTFDNADPYIGVEFDNGGTTSYGWVQISVTGANGVADGSLVVNILDYAWEDSGAGINAGDIGAAAVPEPSTYAMGLGLLALGAAGIRARRRKAAESK